VLSYARGYAAVLSHSLTVSQQSSRAMWCSAKPLLLCAFVHTHIQQQSSAALRHGERLYIRDGAAQDRLQGGESFAKQTRQATAAAAAAASAAAVRKHVQKEVCVIVCEVLRGADVVLMLVACSDMAS
jgi:hypothetical protein